MIDRSIILAQFGGDVELLQRIVEMFLEDAEVLLSAIRDSIARADSHELENAAHKLKGSVANFHASAVVAAALRLETMGHHGDLSLATEALAKLEKEMQLLEPELIALGSECMV